MIPSAPGPCGLCAVVSPSLSPGTWKANLKARHFVSVSRASLPLCNKLNQPHFVCFILSFSGWDLLVDWLVAALSSFGFFFFLCTSGSLTFLYTGNPAGF